MEHRQLGELMVSVVGLGCNNFGMRIDADATKRVVDAAIDAGINYFDTAESYGKGMSEEFLGHALQGRRSDVIVASKWGHTSSLRDGERGERPSRSGLGSTRVCVGSAPITSITTSCIDPIR